MPPLLPADPHCEGSVPDSMLLDRDRMLTFGMFPCSISGVGQEQWAASAQCRPQRQHQHMWGEPHLQPG